MGKRKLDGALKEHFVTVRCDTPTFTKLRTLAQTERRTVANVLAIALDQMLDRLERNPGKDLLDVKT